MHSTATPDTVAIARASQILGVSLAVLAVLTAVLFWRLTTSIAVGAIGLALAALTVIPLVVPAPLRPRFALAVAATATLAAVFSGLDAGLLLAPLVLLAWLRVLVPWRVSHGFALANSLPWRLVCALAIALPGLLLIAGALTGTVELEVIGWAIVGIAVGVAVCLAAGLRLAGLVAALLGLVTLLLTVFIPGLLVIGTWWAGGLLAIVGAAAFIAWGERAESAVPSESVAP